MVIDQVVADAKNTMSMLVAQLNVQLPLDRANGHLCSKIAHYMVGLHDKKLAPWELVGFLY